MKFNGTDDYVATPDMAVAVNAAITLERPLLVKGEPGTGKTVLAEQIAEAEARRTRLRAVMNQALSLQQPRPPPPGS